MKKETLVSIAILAVTLLALYAGYKIREWRFVSCMRAVSDSEFCAWNQ